MRSFPFESGDLPSLSLRDGSTNEAIEAVCQDSDVIEMSDAMMLMPPVSMVSNSHQSDNYDDDHDNDSVASNSSKKKSWDELAAAAGSVLVSPSSASSVVSDLSVMDSPFMEVIDMLLAGKSKAEEHLFLREMVVDLMTEVDHLKEELGNSKRGGFGGGGIISNKNLFALLSKKTSSPVAAATKTVNDMIKKRDQPVSAEEATEMVIQQLTKKIEEQNIRNSDYVMTIKKNEKQLELFKTACRARGKKIQVLQAELDKITEKAKKQKEEEAAAKKKAASQALVANENKLVGKNGVEILLPVRTIAPLSSSPIKQPDKIAAFNKILTKPYALH